MAEPNPATLQIGPGILWAAPLGTAEPISISGAWDPAFVRLGYTEDGSEFSYALTVDAIPVAESLDPVTYRTTSRVASVKFSLAEVSALHLQLALNGGVAAVVAGQNGAPAGLYSPVIPTIGNETRVMLGWDADDGTERWIYRRCIQVAAVGIPRKKAPAKALVPCEFRLEVPNPLPGDGKIFQSFFTAARAA